jgi:hypothetical protein
MRSKLTSKLIWLQSKVTPVMHPIGIEVARRAAVRHFLGANWISKSRISISWRSQSALALSSPACRLNESILAGSPSSLRAKAWISLGALGLDSKSFNPPSGSKFVTALWAPREPAARRLNDGRVCNQADSGARRVAYFAVDARALPALLSIQLAKFSRAN